VGSVQVQAVILDLVGIYYVCMLKWVVCECFWVAHKSIQYLTGQQEVQTLALSERATGRTATKTLLLAQND